MVLSFTQDEPETKEREKKMSNYSTICVYKQTVITCHFGYILNFYFGKPRFNILEENHSFFKKMSVSKLGFIKKIGCFKISIYQKQNQFISLF